MTNTIQVRRGANADLPILNAGELGFSTDSHQTYIGDGATNHEIASTPQIDKLNGIETGATADQTGAEIKTAYDAQSGAVSALTREINYVENNMEISIGTLPAHSVILDIIISVITAFNDSGTDLLSIGLSALHTYLVDTFDVSTVQYGEPASNNNWKYFSSATEIFGYYVGANNDASNGVAKVVVLYVKT